MIGCTFPDMIRRPEDRGLSTSATATFHALKDIDFEVYERSITSLIGPSGCGKSTLLRCFNRMNDLVEGVSIAGEILMEGRR